MQILKQDVPDAPALELSPAQTSIKFDDVTFGYTPEKNILNNLSFEVRPGEKVGIVGGSGSGKSTIIKLLYRSVPWHQASLTLFYLIFHD